MKPLPLSHSALEKFETCPRQYFELKVAKSVPDVKGDAAIWGDYVHQHFEDYLKTRGTHVLPANLDQYRPYLDRILQQKGDLYVEAELAVDTKLQRCEFFAPNVFLRGYADVLRINGRRAWILDHKTGKRKPDSKQMERMAILVFLLYPDIDEIHVGFAWLQVQKNDGKRFTRNDFPTLWNTLMPVVKDIRNAFAKDIWQPRQSGLCHGWCPVTSCEFWKPKKGKR